MKLVNNWQGFALKMSVFIVLWITGLDPTGTQLAIYEKFAFTQEEKDGTF